MTEQASFPLILASASPRRVDLLKQMGIQPVAIRPADIDETPHHSELPRAHVSRLAMEKAKACNISDVPGAAILAADTVVALGRRILPKAENEETARMCLDLLSGRRHRVFGGIALLLATGEMRLRTVETMVQVKRLTEGEKRAYLKSGEWLGKAGGYAIQGLAAAYIKGISGSYSNVVGLDLYQTARLLESIGLQAGAPA